MRPLAHASSPSAFPLVGPVCLVSFVSFVLGALACQATDPLDSTQARKLDASERDALAEAGEREAKEKVAGEAVEAAGVRMTLPEDWTVDPSSAADPNYLLAVGPEAGAVHSPVCSIELRRQGLGALGKAFRVAKREGGTLDYTRGPLRGRARELPGPSPDARVLVHCRGSRKGGGWGAIQGAFESLEVIGEATLASPPAGAGVVELCTAQPVRRTQVCARRGDGGVYCGETEGSALEGVEGLPPAVELACAFGRSCIRDAEGVAWCWRPTLEPVSFAALGPVRRLSDGCFVLEADGRVLCAPADAGLAPESFVAVEGVEGAEAVLDGSSASSGCAWIPGAGTACWGEAEARYSAADRAALAALDGPVSALEDWNGRLCARTGEGRSEAWACAAEGALRRLDGCAARACSCAALSSATFSCEHETHPRVDLRPLARLTGVSTKDGPCVGGSDGRVVCRGPDTQTELQVRAGTEAEIFHALDWPG